MSNEFAEAVVAEAKSYLGVPYVLGGLSRHGIDCRGLARKAFGNVGLRDLIGGPLPNVRAQVKWAKANGRFRDPLSYTPQRGDLIFYSDAKPPSAEPGNPDHIRHVGIVLKPKTVNFPAGRVISALNPVLDVKKHGLNLRGLAIYGYCEPDWASALPEPPIVDPEPTVGDQP